MNEMLTQMEAFSGVFIASTNFMDGLDHAALRRFDIKARFGFLDIDQAMALFCRYCAAHGFSEPTPELRHRLNRLGNLTPGDFAVVARKQHYGHLDTPSTWIAALEAECALKGGARAPIGFVWSQ